MRLPSLLLGPAVRRRWRLTGCLESSKDRFIADYQPLNDRLVKVNGKLVKTLNTPSSPDRLATRADAAVGRARRG